MRKMTKHEAVHERCGWNPDAVPPPMRGGVYERYETRTLGKGFWIGFWSLACLGLAVIDTAVRMISA